MDGSGARRARVPGDRMSGETELEVVSVIAKVLVKECSGMPMELATRYAVKILAALRGEGYLV
jgi:hypothetical protein